MKNTNAGTAQFSRYVIEQRLAGLRLGMQRVFYILRIYP
jgi:hypothetical protein